MKPLDTARAYRQRGWAPTPVGHKTKKPLLLDWPNVDLSDADLPQHFNGKALNIGIRLGAPSGGLVDVDLDHDLAVAFATEFLSATDATFGHVSKPASHFLYAVPGASTVKYQDTDGTMLVELRSTGGQTVFPGSTHPSGELITWDREGDPAPLAFGEVQRGTARLAGAVLLALHWPGGGSRQEAALALSGALLRAGWSEDEAEHFVGCVARMAGDEQVKERIRTVRYTAKAIEEDKPVTGLPKLKELTERKVSSRLAEWLHLGAAAKGPARLDCTDTANGDRYAHDHGDAVRYCFKHKKWYVWDGRRWTAESQGEPERRAMATARGILTEAAALTAHQDSQALAKHAIASQARPRLEAMIWAARPALSIGPDEFDRNPMLLNVANGTLDLTTGHLLPHDRDDCLTKLVPVVYDPDATCHRWDAFLLQVMAGDAEMVAFLQRAVGYTLTGNTDEQCYFTLYGTGQNGKSKFVETIAAMLGDYARPTEFRTLEARRNSEAVRNDLATLRGLRLVTSIEIGQAKRLDEALVKQLTGSDTITARFLYGEYFDFVPEFKLFLASNHKPIVEGMDEGIWRRINLVPFTVYIAPEERDVALGAKLAAELPGVLAWAVRGCLAWQRDGLQVPEKVRAATAEYREESDPLADFLSMCCVRKKELAISAGVLYDVYKTWAADAGVEPMPANALGRAFKDRCISADVEWDPNQKKSVRKYLGIGLKLQAQKVRQPAGIDLAADGARTELET